MTFQVSFAKEPYTRVTILQHTTHSTDCVHTQHTAHMTEPKCMCLSVCVFVGVGGVVVAGVRKNV